MAARRCRPGPQRSRARRLRAADVPGGQLGQRLALPLPRGRQDQRDLGPVLAGPLGDLREVGDLELFAVEHQVVQRPPGGELDVVGQLDLRLGGRGRLEEDADLGEHGRRGRLLGAGEALHRRVELALRDALARGDLAPPGERGGGGRRQVAGHARELLVAGPPRAQRPGERGRRRLGQVAEEAEPGAFRLVGVVEFLDRVAAPLDVRPQLGERLPPRLRGDAALHLDVEQRQVVPPGRDPDGRRVRGVRKAGDHQGMNPLLNRRHPGPRYPRAVREDGNAGDRRIRVLLAAFAWSRCSP